MEIHPEWLDWPETQILIKAFSDTQQIRFVGGAVRDALLRRKVQDVDAATPLRPEQVIQLLTQAGIKAIPTGIDHGTITAVIGKHHFEITTLRKDVTTDGRRATIAYTDDWKEDAKRRDFTMNALYCDTQGVITDYFNGAQDALAGHVRFIGDAAERIREDALRILRFFRFFAHYGKNTIDKDGLTACAQATASIDNLSGERIQQEMMKILVSSHAADVVELMQTNIILRYIVPSVVTVHALARLPALLDKTGGASNPLLALAALVRSSAADHSTLIDTIAMRWKLSKAHYRYLQVLCSKEQEAGDAWDEKTLKKNIRAIGKELFVDRLLLCIAEGVDEVAGFKAIVLARHWQIPVFPLTGDDLLARGFPAGKAMGAKLKELENYWEEQGYTASKEKLLLRL